MPRRENSGALLIDRRAHALPVPFDDGAPVHVPRPRRRRWLRRLAPVAATIVGLLAGATGVVLLCLPATVAAYRAGGTVHIGAMTLRAAGHSGGGETVYIGDASLVLVQRSDGSAAAAAVWVDGASGSAAVCRLHHDGARLIDECTFQAGGRSYSSVDVLERRSRVEWERTYSDGVHAAIAVPAGGDVIPVPFPIGR